MTLPATAVIHTLSGDVFVSDLIDREEPTHVYTWDGERITVGLILIEEASRHVSVPLRLELDDGNQIQISNGMQCLLRDGEDQKAVRDLEVGESLLPLYTKPDGQGYITYYEPGKWNKGALTLKDGFNWRKVSRMVAEHRLGRRVRPGDRIAFIDKSKTNCHPDNLDIQFRAPKQKKTKSKWAEPIFEAHRVIGRINHKVDNVFVDTSREMFSIKGIGTRNLAVGGVFLTTDVVTT